MSAWSDKMRDVAPTAVSLLGALPLDVYRMIFAALDYATLRDACRALNSVLGPIACQTLAALRYTLNATDVVPLERAIDAHVFFTHNRGTPPAQTGDAEAEAAAEAAAEAEACKHTMAVLRECALPLGGFLLLLRVGYGTDNRLLLASFNAQAKLARVLPLRLENSAVTAMPNYAVRFMYAHRRRVYILFYLFGMPPTHVMVRYTLDVDELPLVRVMPPAFAHDEPRQGPQQWTGCSVETCAVAASEPLRLVLCCRGQPTVGLLDQAVMLEMDAD